MMLRDLDIRLQENSDQLQLSKQDCMSPILRDAITLLLFSKDSSLRTFNGESLFTILPKITSGSLGYLQSTVSLLNVPFRERLQEVHEDITDADITVDITDEYKLEVTINITTDDTVVSDVIYTNNLI